MFHANRTCNLIWRIGCLLFASSSACPAFADRDIVFSACYFRWCRHYYHDSDGGTPQQTLEAKGPSHLYRINSDGSRRTQLTFSKYGDFDPTWSPDGKRIFFLRTTNKYNRTDDDKDVLCVIGAGGGKVTRLWTLPQSDWRTKKYQLSPDGQRIALTCVHSPGPQGQPQQQLHLFDLKTHKVRIINDVSDFAWSPDSRNLYLTRETAKNAQNRDEILDLAGGRKTRVSVPIWNPIWMDDKTIAGDAPAPTDYFSSTLRIIDIQGKLLRQIPFRPAKKDDDIVQAAEAEAFKYRPPSGKRFLLVEEFYHRSDGGWYECHRLNLDKGTSVLLREGIFLGFSPDGRLFATANHEWVGPYKRGGERVGPLCIVSARTGKGRAITPRLVSVGGGDWRRKSRP